MARDRQSDKNLMAIKMKTEKEDAVLCVVCNLFKEKERHGKVFYCFHLKRIESNFHIHRVWQSL